MENRDLLEVGISLGHLRGALLSMGKRLEHFADNEELQVAYKELTNAAENFLKVYKATEAAAEQG